MWGGGCSWHTSVRIVILTHVLVLIELRSYLIVQLFRDRKNGPSGLYTRIKSHFFSDAMQRRRFDFLSRIGNEAQHPWLQRPGMMSLVGRDAYRCCHRV